eukprot:scaffold43329_cov27-Prasinocladus_malaysianus.AAC.1
MGVDSSGKGRHGKKYGVLFSPGKPAQEQRVYGLRCGTFLCGVIGLLFLAIAPGTLPPLYNAFTSWLKEGVHKPLQQRRWDRIGRRINE